MVNGENEGVRHSFPSGSTTPSPKETTAWSTTRTYYFMAIAYGYNQYEPYDPVLLTLVKASPIPRQSRKAATLVPSGYIQRFAPPTGNGSGWND